MNTTPPNGMVPIASVHRDAVVVKAKQVRPGDYVFDTTGRRHKVKRVTTLRYDRKIVRVDDVTSHHPHESTITIVKGER